MMTPQEIAKLTEDSAAIAYAKVMSEAIQIAIEECMHGYGRFTWTGIERAVTDVVSFGPTGALNQAIWVWSRMVLSGNETQAEVSAAFGDMLEAGITHTFLSKQVRGPYCKIG